MEPSENAPRAGLLPDDSGAAQVSRYDSVGQVLDEIGELTQSCEEVSIGDVIERFGNRSYGPFLLLPALIGISPVGGIPGMPSFLAALIALLALQIAFGREHLWLPNIIRDRSLTGEKLRHAVEKLDGVGKWLDRWFGPRLEIFTDEPAPRIAAVLAFILCCIVPPLELLPFAVAMPMAVIALLGLALTLRDGILMAVAVCGMIAGIGGAIYWILPA